MLNWQNKNDLLAWLQDHAPTPSTKRTMQSGQSVTIIGGFRPLPDSNSPGFIVRVVSQAEKVYHIAIAVDPRTFLINHIDWGHYVGMDSGPGLYQGDIPAFARHQKLCNVFTNLKG